MIIDKKNGIFDSIEETFEAVKASEHFSAVKEKEKDTTWIGKYMDTLYEYASECQGHIVELGVNRVCSSWAWAKANPSKITLCDVKLFERGSVWLDSFKDLAEAKGIEVVLENKSSLELDLKDIDLLFVDSDHSYKHVTKELELYSNLVSKYIIFHDTSLHQGVVGAVKNFLENNKEWIVVFKDESEPGLTIVERI